MTAIPNPEYVSGGRVWKLPAKGIFGSMKKTARPLVMLCSIGIAVMLTMTIMTILKIMSFFSNIKFVHLLGIQHDQRRTGTTTPYEGYNFEYIPFYEFKEPTSIAFLSVAAIVLMFTTYFVFTFSKNGALPKVIGTIGMLIALIAVCGSVEMTRQIPSISKDAWMSERYGFTPNVSTQDKNYDIKDGVIYKDASTGIIAEAKKIDNSYYLYNVKTDAELPVIAKKEN